MQMQDKSLAVKILKNSDSFSVGNRNKAKHYFTSDKGLILYIYLG